MPAPKTDEKPQDPAVEQVGEGTGEPNTAVEGDTVTGDGTGESLPPVADDGTGEPLATAGPDPTPDQVGYCHTGDCPQYGVEVPLWKNLESVPVMCGCGHLLSPDRVEDKPEA